MVNYRYVLEEIESFMKFIKGMDINVSSKVKI